MAPYVTIGTTEAEQTLHAHRDNPFMLPEGALVAATKVDRAAMSNMKGVLLNLAALPRETLY